MANADDMIVMFDPATGKPISSSYSELSESQLNPDLSDIVDH
jgi:hypothetical protein